MTDKEIRRSLRLCARGTDCRRCAFEGKRDCISELCLEALGVINRQCANLDNTKRYYKGRKKKILKEARTEAIKEFAERLKKYEGRRGVPIASIDNLVKEMTDGHEAE